MDKPNWSEIEISIEEAFLPSTVETYVALQGFMDRMPGHRLRYQAARDQLDAACSQAASAMRALTAALREPPSSRRRRGPGRSAPRGARRPSGLGARA